jgi:hypothetical protein
MAIETSGNISGGIDGSHIIGSGGTPTVVLGPGAGAGSATITGTDNGFTITLTAGAGTSPNSIICTITFNSAFPYIPNSVFSAKNTNSAAAKARHFINNISTSQLTLNITNPALSSGLVYVWTIITI